MINLRRTLYVPNEPGRRAILEHGDHRVEAALDVVGLICARTYIEEGSHCSLLAQERRDAFNEQVVFAPERRAGVWRPLPQGSENHYRMHVL